MNKQKFLRPMLAFAGAFAAFAVYAADSFNATDSGCTVADDYMIFHASSLSPVFRPARDNPFCPALSLFVHNCMVRTALYAGRLTAGIGKTQLTFLHDAVLRGRQRAVRTYQHAGQAADTFVTVDPDNAVFLADSSRNAAFHAHRILAVSAGYGKCDLVIALYMNAGENLTTLKRLRHIRDSGIGPRAVKFAQMTPETPFFVNIDSFHSLLSCV